MIKLVNYKGYELTIDKSKNNGTLVISTYINGFGRFKWSYIFYTEKQAKKEFIKLAKSI